MSTYLIGDVQGCYSALQQLLEHLSFNPQQDQLGFVGDLINRGPDSLQTLRFIAKLKNPLIVLGNHDLHLLAVGYGVVPVNHKDTFTDILNAPDKIELLDFLRYQKLFYTMPNDPYCLVHAGIPPQWSIEQAQTLAKEVEQSLQGPHFLKFLSAMHGKEPTQWSDQLTGFDRLRYITNALTRLRFCTQEGQLDLSEKLATHPHPDLFKPWFTFRKDEKTIAFGHWAALEGNCNNPKTLALDTGCVWGGRLCAYCIEEQKYYYIK